MLKLGLTGGLASGKTTAADYFRSKGAAVFNADQEAKSLLFESNLIATHVISAFGEEVKASDGRIDPGKLAEQAFVNSQSQHKLNEIIWPEVLKMIKKACINAETHGKCIFVVDAALLIEARFTNYFHHVLLICADREIRIQRALQRRNLSRSQILDRMDLQLPDDEKKKAVSHTINNNGNEEGFILKLEKFLTEVLAS